MAASIIDELITLLSFKVDASANQEASKFSTMLKGIGTYAEVISGALMGAATAALFFVQKANEAAAGIDKLGDLTGQSKQDIQLWSRAVEQAGGQASSAKQDIMSLTKAMNPTMPGEFNQGLFMLFGGNYLNKFKDVDQLMGALADKFQGMSKGKALNWAGQIGISNDTLLLLQKGSAGVAAFKKEVAAQMPVLTDSELKNARAFETHWTRIKQTFVAFGERAASNVAPAMERIANAMDKWLKNNKELLEGRLLKFIQGVSDGLGNFVKIITWIINLFAKWLPGFRELIKDLGETKTISILLTSALIIAAGAFVVVHGKIILITAAVTGLILVLKDMYNWIAGNDSYMGKMFKTVELQIEYMKQKYPKIAALMGAGPIAGEHELEDQRRGINSHAYDGIIKSKADKYGVPEWMIRAVIRAESGFDSNAQSNAGAQGLMQLMPATAKGLGVGNPFDPEQNIEGGTKYLKQLLDKYNGNGFLAMEGYNWGPGNLDKALSTGSQWRPQETTAYVNKVMGAAPGGAGATINITNNISGDNAPGIASETTRSMSNTLQTLFPGGLQQVTN